MKMLKDLNLMDRFLFAEAMEDSENVQLLLEIILGQEVVLKYLPQTEKEQRSVPWKRFVKLDVWAQDEDDTIYNAEVQKKNTGNLPRRSRFYQSLIDNSMLKSGETNFNKMGNVFVIVIAPFDLFGQNRYMYSFQMRCKEKPEMTLEDGATRIFLNTHGMDDENISAELWELLRYMEQSNDQISNECQSDKIHHLHNNIKAIKDSEKVSVRYMQEWEEKIYIREEGREQGAHDKLKEQVSKKLAKGLSVEEIADILEENIQTINDLILEIAGNH